MTKKRNSPQLIAIKQSVLGDPSREKVTFKIKTAEVRGLNLRPVQPDKCAAKSKFKVSVVSKFFF